MGQKGKLKIIIAGMASLPTQARRAALYRKAVLLAFGTEKKTAGLRGEVNVVFLGRAAMRRMNSHYLGHAADTDVIAFPYDGLSGEPLGDEHPIGDIFISAWMTRRQARIVGHSVAVEAATLGVHGALHLIGHDDQQSAAKELMFKIQGRIVASLL